MALFEPRPKADPQEAARRSNRLRDLRALLFREARRYAPGEMLVVMQQAVEKALLDLGPLPPNVLTAHHNNIAGRDEWKYVRALTVVGRTMPPPYAAERMAEALTGRAIPAPMQWYERADAVREMTDGSTLPAEADRHTDPIAEAVRWQIAEGEIVQIIGRARGVNRTAANPVDVLVLTDVPLPMPLAGTLAAADLEPNVLDLMIAAGGVVLENPTDAAAAYPSLWPNREAAKKALQRGKLGTFPYIDLIIGECPQLRRVDYKVAGQGKQAAVAGIDPSLCPDPAAFLTAALGPLAWFRVEDVPPPDPEPPRPKPEPPGPELSPEPPTLDPEPPPATEPDPSRPDLPGIVLPNGHAVPFPDLSAWPAFRALPKTYDVPGLPPEVAAFVAPDGWMIVPCPHCGKQHHHGGFGHRLAHCDDPEGRGYLLKDAGPLPPRGSGAPAFEAIWGNAGDD